jgi:general secretion pathway protein A
MLSRYFGFREDPFGTTPDPRCLYESSTHCEALASLKYGYSSNHGFIALIAPPGMGKTSLLFRFLEEIRQSARTAFIFDIDPLCEPREIVSFILRDIGIVPGKDPAEMHEQLRMAMLSEAKAGRRFVVVIDEAQNLSDAALEVVRMLTNFETSRAKLMQVVLAGQPQLSEKLMQPSLLQLRQRISTFCRIEPFSVEQTSAYIDHRLKFAGYTGPPLFSDEAMERLTAASHGIPRNINNLCFNALSLCCAMKRKKVSGSMVDEVIADQQLTPESAGTTAIVPAAVVIPIDRPGQRNGTIKRGWPWVISIAAVLVASLLGGFGSFELGIFASHHIQSKRASATTVQSVASAIPPPKSGPADRDVKVVKRAEDPHILDDSTLRDYRARLADLRRQVSDLRLTLPPSDYRIQRLEAQIVSLEQQSSRRRAEIIRRFGAHPPESSPGKQLIEQAYIQPQGIGNPALGHPNVTHSGEAVRSRHPAAPALLPAASRAKAEAVEPETPTLDAPDSSYSQPTR